MTPRTYAYAILFGPAALCVVVGMAVTLASHPKKPTVELVSEDISPGSVVVYGRDGSIHPGLPSYSCVTIDQGTGNIVDHGSSCPELIQPTEGSIWSAPNGLHIYLHGQDRKMSDFMWTDELKR